jgi:hypothetical protein
MELAVPHQTRPLEPPTRARVRALRRHLVDALRDLRRAKHPDRLIQPAPAKPPPTLAPILRAGCATCQGYCCTAGGDHAFLDERTMARVLRDRPTWNARRLIAAYVGAVAPLSFARSCLFHGRDGCTLDAGLRATLCASFYCTSLEAILRNRPDPATVTFRAVKEPAEQKRDILFAGSKETNNG